jgi:hypothetical protein
MSKRISQLDPDVSPDAGSIFESERAGVSYRLTVPQLQALIGASLALAGAPTAPTPAPGDSDTSIATTAFVANLGNSKADLASPTFTGDPKAPTPAPGDNDTSIATTAFVANSVSSKADIASPTFTGDPKAPTATVTDNDTSIATTAFVESKIAQKRVWTSYTPSLTASSGTFTSAAVSGTYMVAFGICFVRINVAITTKGTGTTPLVTLPFAALANSANFSIPGGEVAVSGKGAVGRIVAGLDKILIAGTDASDVAVNGSSIFIMGSYPIA